jgi:hypothetical protein
VVPFAPIDLFLNTLNSGSPDTLSLIMMTVTVSPLPESSLTSIDFTRAVVDSTGGTDVSSVIGTLYICVALVVVRSTAFNKNVSAKVKTPC